MSGSEAAMLKVSEAASAAQNRAERPQLQLVRKVEVDRSRDALLTDFGKTTLEDRYLLAGESYQDMFARVATAFADDADHALPLQLQHPEAMAPVPEQPGDAGAPGIAFRAVMDIGEEAHGFRVAIDGEKGIEVLRQPPGAQHHAGAVQRDRCLCLTHAWPSPFIPPGKPSTAVPVG